MKVCESQEKLKILVEKSGKIFSLTPPHFHIVRIHMGKILIIIIFKIFPNYGGIIEVYFWTFKSDMGQP